MALSQLKSCYLHTPREQGNTPLRCIYLISLLEKEHSQLNPCIEETQIEVDRLHTTFQDDEINCSMNLQRHNIYNGEGSWYLAAPANTLWIKSSLVHCLPCSSDTRQSDPVLQIIPESFWCGKCMLLEPPTTQWLEVNWVRKIQVLEWKRMYYT